MASGVRTDRSSDDAKMRRKQSGMYLKNLRSKAKLTQKALAEKVGLEYYTFVSQIENVSGRVPVALYRAFADAYGVDVQAFSRFMLRLYDPDLYGWVFFHGEEQSVEEQFLELMATSP